MSETELMEFIDFLCDRYYASSPTKTQIKNALSDWKRKQESDEW